MLSKEQLESGIKELPPLPAAIAEILAALNKKNVAIEFLMSKIIQDPALSSKVLSLANSPFYGMSGNIASINDACVVLGMHTLRNIAMAVGVAGNYPADSGNYIDIGGLWQHAIGTAVAARVLALECRVDQELAFTTGLLHDIGKMVIDQCFPDENEQTLKTSKADDCLLFEAERKLLGVDHGEVGAMVARRWNLPDAIVDALHNHHSTDVSKRSKLIDLITVADIVSRGLEIGNPGDDLIPSLEADMLERLGLDMAIIIEHLPEIDELSRSSDSLFN